MKLIFERLENNNHPLPSYATAGSATFDLRACLSRTCKIHVEGGYTYPGHGDITQVMQNHLIDFHIRGSRRFYEYTPNSGYGRAELIIEPRETILIPTGFKASFKDAVLRLYIKSSLGIKNLVLANYTRIIESDYRGELFIAVSNMSDFSRHIYDGDRIAQGILEHYVQAELEEGVVDQTVRGEGGFGSINRL